jgi:hypothetical protein
VSVSKGEYELEQTVIVKILEMYRDENGDLLLDFKCLE